MKYHFSKTIVIALGGSIVHPDDIDVAFLKKFKKFLIPFMRGSGDRPAIKFVLVIGGGHLARRFQDAAHRVSPLADDDKDWIGIHATHLNGHLLRTVFRDIADPVMIDARGRIPRLKYPVTIAAGWRPGWSTDYVALQLAADFGAGEAIIAGKPSHVYESDPAKARGGGGGDSSNGKDGRAKAPKRFDAMTWPEYRKLIPARWKPGLHAPVDPVGAAFASRAGIRAIIVDARNLRNFAALLNEKAFQGTIIG